MYENDPDVFAVLTPADKGIALKAFSAKPNGPRFVAARPAHLVLRFSQKIVNAFDGIQLGADPDCCDVVLNPSRKVKGISKVQGTISLSPDLRWWYKDGQGKDKQGAILGSTYGTAVSYDGQHAHSYRKNDRWILAYGPDERTTGWDTILIHTLGKLVFQIQFPNQRSATPAYRKNLESFLNRHRVSVPALTQLSLGGHATAPPSQIHTPNDQAIYITKGHIARGAQGEVTVAVKARDGNIYAVKRIFPPTAEQLMSSKANKRAAEDPGTVWINFKNNVSHEYTVMQHNRHPNVMPVIDFQDNPTGPMIVMPYYRKGNLENWHLIKDWQIRRAVVQILCGLRHLHRRSIIHRDLKRANILIGDDESMVIGDFGLAKHTPELLATDFCGTHTTIAPEVIPGPGGVRAGYGMKADIWSAGVVAAELFLTNPPRMPDDRPYLKGGKKQGQWREWHDAWTNALYNAIEKEPGIDDDFVYLIKNMLSYDPKTRPSADECLELGVKLGLFVRTANGEYAEFRGRGDRDDTPGAQRGSRPAAKPPTNSSYLSYMSSTTDSSSQQSSRPQTQDQRGRPQMPAATGGLPQARPPQPQVQPVRGPYVQVSGNPQAPRPQVQGQPAQIKMAPVAGGKHQMAPGYAQMPDNRGRLQVMDKQGRLQMPPGGANYPPGKTIPPDAPLQPPYQQSRPGAQVGHGQYPPAPGKPEARPPQVLDGRGRPPPRPVFPSEQLPPRNAQPDPRYFAARPLKK